MVSSNIPLCKQSRSNPTRFQTWVVWNRFFKQYIPGSIPKLYLTSHFRGILFVLLFFYALCLAVSLLASFLFQAGTGGMAFLSRKANQPLVTVIMTSYNVEDYIDESIKSALTQTYENLEIIMVDDASNDKTTAKIKAAAKMDKRIRYNIMPTNSFGGVGMTGNIGLDTARGKYIAFVDADDFVERNFIERMVSVAERAHAEVVLCQITLYDTFSSAHREGPEWRVWPNETFVRQSRIKPVAPKDYPDIFYFTPYPWRKLYRRDFLNNNNIRFPEGDYVFEDNSFQWLIHMHVKNMSFLSERLIHYRVGRKHQTTTSWKQTKTGNETVRETILTDMKSAKAINFIPIMNYNARLITNFTRSVADSGFIREQFRDWLLDTTWFVQRLDQIPNNRIMAKVRSQYYRTLEKWENAFGLDSITASNSIIRPDKTLSIVVSTKNHEKLLPRIIRLLKRVSVSSEVIFVDDNSTDKTLSLLHSATKDTDSWYLLHTNDIGRGRARNFAQLFCEGKYVMFLDGGSEFEPYALDSAAQDALLEDIDVMLLRKIGVGKKNEIRELSNLFRILSVNAETLHKLSAHNSIFAESKLLKRDLINRADIFHGAPRLNNGMQFHWQSLFSARSVKVFPQGVMKKVDETEAYDSIKEMLLVPYALYLTNHALERNGMQKGDGFRHEWLKYCTAWLEEKEKTVPVEYRSEFNQSANALLKSISK